MVGATQQAPRALKCAQHSPRASQTAENSETEPRVPEQAWDSKICPQIPEHFPQGLEHTLEIQGIPSVSGGLGTVSGEHPQTVKHAPS